jgi:aromatic amino acid aminotransferase I
MGCGLVPVPIDAQGADAEALDRMLDNWKPAAHGPKPRVFYTVTTGQNPTGTTPSLRRLRALYAVARKHDLVLIEDDPYYMLQLGDYHRDSAMMEEMHVAGAPVRPNVKSSLDDFAATLAPTLISLDVDGRVARCESMSKVFFPGARLGWVILNPLFRERYERLSEVTTQMGNDESPSAAIDVAYGQDTHQPGVLCSSPDGAVKDVAQRRRLGHGRVHLLGQQASTRLRESPRLRAGHLEARDGRGCRSDFLRCTRSVRRPGCGCRAAELERRGMFIWMKVHLEKHPRFRSNEGSRPRTNMADLMQELFDNVSATSFSYRL